MTNLLKLQNWTRVTAVKLFKDGNSLAVVDSTSQQWMYNVVTNFVNELENSDKGSDWLEVPNFIPEIHTCHQ